MMNTNNPPYRKSIIRTSETLDCVTRQLYTCLFNVAMTGELAQVNEILNTGESLKLSEADLRRLDDQNAKIIIKVLDLLVASQDDLCLRNNLGLEDGGSNSLSI